VHRIRKGLDLPLAGAPTQAVDVAPRCARVALVGADYIGLKPTMLVQPGERVLRGTPLFEDKKRPGVRFVAPAAGTVAAIHRGEMRAFQSLVIDVDPDDGPDAQVAFASFPGAPAEPWNADAVRDLLVESGMWTAFRARPFSGVPAPSSAPHSIFVTAIDTHPHAPAVDVVLAERSADFHAGLDAIATLCTGRT
jgi:Na+-transporting NADH:ubiquinone oxidoreductase subunit A